MALGSLVALAGHFIASSAPADSARAAERFGKALEERLEDLGEHMHSALASAPGFDELPSDEVVYFYRNDSLLWWRGCFPIGNDDIRENAVINVSPSIGRAPSRPLTEVGETPSFVTYGNRSYVVRSLTSDNITVIGGIEIMDSFGDNMTGVVNPSLPLSGRYRVQSMDSGAGSPVLVGGEPVCMILALTSSGTEGPAEWAMWLALVMFLAASVSFVLGKRSLGRLAIAIPAIIMVLYLCNRHALGSSHGDLRLFSPEVYAGEVLPASLGSLILLCAGVVLVAWIANLCREAFSEVFSRHKGLRIAAAALSLVLAVALLLFVYLIIKDIAFNSGIPLQLTNLYSVNGDTILVYLSLLGVLSVVPMLFHSFFSLFVKRKDSSDRIWKIVTRLIYSILAGACLVGSASYFSLEKEGQIAATWANRLAMDRDIDLEPKLILMENSIAADPVMAGLVQLNTANHIVLRRLKEYYYPHLSSNYSLSVYIFNEEDWNDPAGARLYNDRIRSSEPIVLGSHFLYGTDINGRTRYSGVFDYFSTDSGISRLLVCIDSKSGKSGSVFSGLLGLSDPGDVSLLPIYSHARYYNRALVSFEGEYAYPTLIVKDDGTKFTVGDSRSFVEAGYRHFLTCVGEGEFVTISRPVTPWVSYIIVSVFLAVLMFLLLSLLFPSAAYGQTGARSYYKNRIGTVMLLSLTVALLVLSGISIYFIYKRSHDDRSDVMRTRINDVQTLLQSRLRNVPSLEEISSSELGAMMEEIGSTLRLDLIMYRPDGRACQSTTHEIFERRLIGTRINERALDEIKVGHKRYYIGSESLLGHDYYGLYAPVFNAEGNMLGIVYSPYTENAHSFRSDAAMHLLAVLTLLVILLFLVRLFSARYVDKMFKPITAIGGKMSETDLSNLEYIIYDHDDEVTSLVNAYNRMVKAFSDSSRRLAQAERDKAWSEMARQVAHEIKNPLTPIKLRLQMLIRLKESGNPLWTEKFDEVSSVVLEHIDILADTANQFSTFAKLYSEDPVEFDLDAMIKEEVSLFEGREGVSLSYMGFPGAKVVGPKPQLTRVVVNIITNAIQALENQEDGKILVALRNSQRDGYYDIVVEDNGPGVKEENRAKLFTPDFTTKTGGSGLGLAICRNIVEKCNGDITYSRSFTLGGACFTVRYPKP